MKAICGTKMIAQPYILEDVVVYFDYGKGKIYIETNDLKLSSHYDTQKDDRPNHDCELMHCSGGRHVLAIVDVSDYQAEVLMKLIEYLPDECTRQIDGIVRV